MSQIRTGYSCPACKQATGATNEILADSSRLICSKVPEHVWPDVDDFYSLKPTLDFKQAQERPAPQSGHTNLNVSIPVNTLNALQNRYGEKMMATVAGLLNVLAEGEPMIISDTDVQRMGMTLNERPKSSGHLVGMIFALQQQVTEARQEAELATSEVKAYEKMSPGKVVLDLGENFNYAADRAKNENLPVKVWLERNVSTALANTWF